eukprot:TRINITY_DN15319_c0_g1_i1.p1 TRINITY_DN15319_c0_g1~~TRINITY_DN15319_c0_g1_i1.p1  ORF type:complete len:213 (+),score=27.54 TRINITY_DN15319_c0_g1_i1:47-685(+)
MPIKYAAVFQGATRVAEHPVAQFPALSDICQKLATKESSKGKTNRAKLTDDSQGVDINYTVNSQGLILICVTTQDLPIRVGFDFLARVEKNCKGDRRDWTFDKDTLRKEVAWSNDPQNDIARKVQGQIDEVKDIMLENVDKVLERHDKLETMVQKSDQMANEAQTFFKRGRDIRRKLCCQEVKLNMMMVGAVVIVIIVIVLIVCKPNFSSCS